MPALGGSNLVKEPRDRRAPGIRGVPAATISRASQLAAWASAQSRPLSSRALLEDEFARLKQKFGEGRIPLPSFWGGFRVVPDAFEFWQGRPNRLHDRFSYTLADDGHWRIERLAP